MPSPLYHDGRLYIVNDTGIATCLNAVDGHTVWQHRLRGRFSMSPVGCRDRILVTNEDGQSTIFRAADRFEALAENDLDEAVLATPAWWVIASTSAPRSICGASAERPTRLRPRSAQLDPRDD